MSPAVAREGFENGATKGQDSRVCNVATHARGERTTTASCDAAQRDAAEGIVPVGGTHRHTGAPGTVPRAIANRGTWAVSTDIGGGGLHEPPSRLSPFSPEQGEQVWWMGWMGWVYCFGWTHACAISAPATLASLRAIAAGQHAALMIEPSFTIL